METLRIDLEKYAKEGWRARIKTVKGLKYIVLRLRGKDKSLGPYNEELWKRLEALGMTPVKKIKHVPVEDSVPAGSLADLQKQIDKLKHDHVYFKQQQGRFSASMAKWKAFPKVLEKEMKSLKRTFNKWEKIFNKKGGKRKIRAEDVLYTWKHIEDKPTSTIAEEVEEITKTLDLILDDIHIPDFNVASSITLKAKVLELEERIDSCPISDVSNRFVCPKCGSRGIVKVPVICDECNLQVAVGWHSTKEEND